MRGAGGSVAGNLSTSYKIPAAGGLNDGVITDAARDRDAPNEFCNFMNSTTESPNVSLREWPTLESAG